jgi:hypothetical protein
MRQAAEWGIPSVEASLPWLKDRIRYEDFGERKRVLKMWLLLYNLRARRVGINQIKNTYMTALDLDAQMMFLQQHHA